MPVITFRKIYIENLTQIVDYRAERADIRLKNQEVDSYEDYKDEMYRYRLRSVAGRRYFYRASQYRQRVPFDWDDVLSADSNHYNDAEFQQLFRLSRESFHELHEMIKDHRVFKAKSDRTRKPRPAYQQLMVYLYRVGKEGNGGNGRAVGAFFRIGYGTVNNYVKNVITAILSIKNWFLNWPTDQEKEDMKLRCGVSKGFFHCVGIIDGTLIFF